MLPAVPKPDRTLAAFGRNVRQLRDSLGLSQEKLATKANLDRSFLSGIESGSRNPGVLTVAKLAKALGVTTARLMEDVP